MSEQAEALTFDKSGWGDGPWQSEPDRVEFEHAGLPCLMLRGRSGNWCGYAAVPPGHALHGQGYSDVDVEVHGGLTYAGACQGHICHVPKLGEPDDVWWFGFDCNHAWDIAPAYDLSFRGRDDDSTYRDARYVRGHVERLAEQLVTVK